MALVWLRCTTSVEHLSCLNNVGFSILLVSAALMRPNRPKRFRLQLYIYIYTSHTLCKIYYTNWSLCNWFTNPKHLPGSSRAKRKCKLFGLPAGNRTRDPANLMQYSVNWALEAVAESMSNSSVFMRRECLFTYNKQSSENAIMFLNILFT